MVLAYILAAAFPPFGLLLGIGLGVRTGSKHWRWIVLVSIVAGVIWGLIIASGALSSTNEGY